MYEIGSLKCEKKRDLSVFGITAKPYGDSELGVSFFSRKLFRTNAILFIYLFNTPIRRVFSPCNPIYQREFSEITVAGQNRILGILVSGSENNAGYYYTYIHTRRERRK